jgi:hypothetical protein
VDQQVYEFFPDYNSFFGTRGDVFSNKRDMEPIFDVLAPVLALLSFELDRHA